jgi:hypothetical protein
MNKTGLTLLGLAAFCGGNANAENLQISTLHPAKVPAALNARTVAVTQFGGSEGIALQNAVELELRRMRDEGVVNFRIVPYDRRSRPDLVISGNGITNIKEYGVIEDRKECIERDTKGKCVTKGKVPVKCLRRDIKFTGSIDVTRGDDRRQLAYWETPMSSSRDFCKDGNIPPLTGSERDAISNWVQSATEKLSGLAPRFVREEIGLLEDKDGLSPDNAARFKTALKLTKSNPSAACAIWQEIDAAQPGHLSTTYNVGLCHEQARRFGEANTYYAKVQRMGQKRSKINSALERLEINKRGEAELAERDKVFAGDR